MTRFRLNCAVAVVASFLFPFDVLSTEAAPSESATFVTWREPNEGAYTIDVPRGWKVAGGVRRQSPVDIRTALNVTSPDGVIRIFIGDYDLAPRREPDQLTQIAGMHEGRVYDGVLLARYMTGLQVAQSYPGWKLCRQARIKQSGVLQRESQTLTTQVARYGQSMATAATASVGEAIFQCPAGEGFVMATTLLTRPMSGRGVSGWFIYELSGFTTSDPKQAFFAKYVLSAMLASRKDNPEWDARVSQAAGQYAQAMMQLNNAMTQSTIQHARQQAAQGSAGGWNHPNTGDVPKVKHNAESERQRDIANRGTREVCDDLGTCKTVDNSWATVWRDHSGNVVPGSAAGYPPDYSGQWTQMK
jgi:hypothetical protein